MAFGDIDVVQDLHSEVGLNELESYFHLDLIVIKDLYSKVQTIL